MCDALYIALTLENYFSKSHSFMKFVLKQPLLYLLKVISFIIYYNENIEEEY